jgi:hypothetical protein
MEGREAAGRLAVVTAADMIAGHVGLDVSCPDRLYLNGYVNKLQTPGGVIYFFHDHPGVGAHQGQDRLTLEVVGAASGQLPRPLAAEDTDTRDAPQARWPAFLPPDRSHSAAAIGRYLRSQAVDLAHSGLRSPVCVRAPDQGDRCLVRRRLGRPEGSPRRRSSALDN